MFTAMHKRTGDASDMKYISRTRMIGKVFHACHIGRQRARLYGEDKRTSKRERESARERRATNLV